MRLEPRRRARRAELLAGRNHMARELHDVLAHTLSALAVQLEALDATIGAEVDATPAVTDQLDRTKRLVRAGLDEARGAVRALREDSPPLEQQLAQFVGDRNCAVEVLGEPRRLPPEVTLTLYRVAQEAFTNVVKHAPGARARIKLDFGDEHVLLSVSNDSGSNDSGSNDTGSNDTGTSTGGSLLSASGGGTDCKACASGSC